MQLALSNSAKREYKRLPEYEKVKVKKKLTSLENNPYSGKKLSGELGGYYALRAWPYRILYEINKNISMFFFGNKMLAVKMLEYTAEVIIDRV